MLGRFREAAYLVMNSKYGPRRLELMPASMASRFENAVNQSTYGVRAANTKPSELNSEVGRTRKRPLKGLSDSCRQNDDISRSLQTEENSSFSN